MIIQNHNNYTTVTVIQSALRGKISACLSVTFKIIYFLLFVGELILILICDITLI